MIAVRVRCAMGALVAMAATGFVAATGFMAAADSAPSPKLLAAWHLDEADGAMARNAVAKGKPIALRQVTQVPGRFGQAALFNGFTSLGQGPAMELRRGAIEFWVKAGRPERVGPILGMGYWSIDYLPANGRGIAFRYYTGKPEPRVIFSTGQMLKPNAWRYVVLTWGDGLKLYVDGKLAAHRPGGAPWFFDLLLAADAQGGRSSLALDELRVYDGPLPADVIAARFSAPDYVRTPAQPSTAPPTGPSRKIDAAKFYDPKSPDCGFQAAIHSLPAAGGVVQLPPGRFLMRRGLVLRGGMTLCGAGPSTTLVVPATRSSPLTRDAKVGDVSVEVRTPRLFSVGDQVAVSDQRVHGWYVTQTTVQSVLGKTVRLASPVLGQLLVARKAQIYTRFPMLYAYDARDLVVRDLRVLGRPNDRAGFSDFALAGFHSRYIIDSQLRNVVVENWHSDGFSVQCAQNVAVTGCKALYNGGHGFHPGTTSWRLAFTDNLAGGNGGCGLYFCLRVRRSVFTGSVFSENGGHGIGGLGGGGDEFNLVANNICVRNGNAGIHANKGANNVIQGNICLSNSRRRAGAYPGIQLYMTTDTMVVGNRCADDQPSPTQRRGIIETDNSDRNLIANNLCAGCPDKGVVIQGKKTVSNGNVE